MLAGVMKTFCSKPAPDVVLERLAYDVKATLSALRKLRRNWLFLQKAAGRKGNRRWPEVADEYPVLVELLEFLQDGAESRENLEPDAEDGAAAHDDKLLFDVSLSDDDLNLRAKLGVELERKRKAVFEDCFQLNGLQA